MADGNPYDARERDRRAASWAPPVRSDGPERFTVTKRDTGDARHRMDGELRERAAKDGARHATEVAAAKMRWPNTDHSGGYPR